MKTFQLLFLTLLFTFHAFAQTPGVKSDLAVYPQGTPPQLQSAGTKTIDPVFGTPVLRVTDSADGANFGTAYSYWSTFSKNNTQLLCFGETSFIRKFDPINFALLAKQTLPRPSAQIYTTFEDAIWSHADDNKLFVHADAKIVALNTQANVYSTVADLTSQLPTKAYLYQMSASLDDDVFAFTIKDGNNYNVIGYAAYKVSTNTFLNKTFVTSLDEVQIDKSGKFLVVKTGNSGAGVIEVKIFDLTTSAVTDLTDNAPDCAPGHSDNGNGTVFGADNWNNAFTARNLANPHTFKQILTFGNDWTVDAHISALADDESSILISTYSDKISGVFNNELFTLATDGSRAVKRFLHHYSIYRGYNDAPRANVSRDGKYVAFTSNWGTNRTDLFVAKMPTNAPPIPPKVNPFIAPFPKGLTSAQRDEYLKTLLMNYWESVNKW